MIPFAELVMEESMSRRWCESLRQADLIQREVRHRYKFTIGKYAAISAHELAVTTLAPAAGAAYSNLWAPTRPCEIVHIEVWQTTTTALPQLELGRTSARGTQTTTSTPSAAANTMNPGYMLAATAVIDTAWSANPTFVSLALPMRMADIAGVVGTSGFWDWGDQDPLQLVNGNGICIVNNAGGTGAVTRNMYKWRE